MIESVSYDCVEVVKHYEQGPNGGHAERKYLCPAQQWTIGYGHMIKAGEYFGEPMSEEEASVLLMEDLNFFAPRVSNLLKREPTQNQFDALVSLAFNTGIGVKDGKKGDFADSTLLEHFNKGYIQLAAAEFHKWVYSGRRILNGLVRRRKTEAHLFLTGEVRFFNQGGV